MAARLAMAMMLLAAMLACGKAVAAPQARALNGVLDLRGQNLDKRPPTELAGEWSFAWNRFIDPQQAPSPDAAPPAYAEVPGSWTSITAGGKAPGSDGHASYSLQVLCDPGQRLSLLVPTERTAHRLYVNGRLVAQQGAPGPSAPTAWGAVRRRAEVTPAFACPLNIVMHLSSYEHRAGGFVRSLVAAPERQIVALREQRLSLDTGLLGSFLVLGLIPILFFAARPKDKTPLLFGLFCFSIAAYADLTGERALLQLRSAETAWGTYLRLEYLAWFLTQLFFALFAQKLFEREFNRQVLRFMVAACGLSMVFVLAMPARNFSQLAPAGQALSVAIGVYVTWVAALAAHRRRVGAQAFLVGMAFLLLIVLLDTLQYNRGQSTVSFTPVGLLFFVLAPAVALARRLARALNAEELRALEQREKANLLVRSTRAGIYDLDTTRELTTWSTRLKEMLGHAADADTSAWPHLHEFIHPADRADVQRSFASQMKDRSVASGELRHPPQEYRLLRADGTPIWVLAEAISLTGSDRRPLRYICSFIDITERRSMEDSLRASHERIAAQAVQLERQNEALMGLAAPPPLAQASTSGEDSHAAHASKPATKT
ncbi:MAG: 7TM diverse intracellular signaling domain-containing protein [Pseudomonadota bacterium]